MRRWPVLLLVVLGVAGCKREPSFDDRYNAATNEIDQRAARIDNQLNAAQPETPPVSEQR